MYRVIWAQGQFAPIFPRDPAPKFPGTLTGQGWGRQQGYKELYATAFIFRFFFFRYSFQNTQISCWHTLLKFRQSTGEAVVAHIILLLHMVMSFSTLTT